jgi:hypothetical protein
VASSISPPPPGFPKGVTGAATGIPDGVEIVYAALTIKDRWEIHISTDKIAYYDMDHLPDIFKQCIAIIGANPMNNNRGRQLAAPYKDSRLKKVYACWLTQEEINALRELGLPFLKHKAFANPAGPKLKDWLIP